MTEVHERRSKR